MSIRNGIDRDLVMGGGTVHEVDASPYRAPAPPPRRANIYCRGAFMVVIGTMPGDRHIFRLSAIENITDGGHIDPPFDYFGAAVPNGGIVPPPDPSAGHDHSNVLVAGKSIDVTAEWRQLTDAYFAFLAHREEQS